jgi:xanthine dehydrogenase accessory factor
LREGTSLLFWEDGTQIGMISAGCLETDLALQAQKVFCEGLERIVTYHLKDEDDVGWGQGAGCNGVLSILLEPLDEKLRKYLCTLREYMNKRILVFHMKKNVRYTGILGPHERTRRLLNHDEIPPFIPR